jgi:hypothetical protein
MNVEEPARGASSATPGRFVSARRGSVWHRIAVEPGFLRCELFNRQTVEETRKFLETVLAAALEHRIPFVLIRVRNSIPIFTVERYRFSHYLDLAFKSKYRIALVGDTLELRIAHQYIATLACMRGVRLRAFSDEASAVGWLTAGDAPPASPERPA